MGWNCQSIKLPDRLPLLRGINFKAFLRYHLYPASCEIAYEPPTGLIEQKYDHTSSHFSPSRNPWDNGVL